MVRLTRALDEYFVGGIKTNIPLFRRILRDADFRAAKLDIGFLNRLLSAKEDRPADAKNAARPRESLSQVATIAAGMFAAVGLTASGPGESEVAAVPVRIRSVSNWKSAGRGEALR